MLLLKQNTQKEEIINYLVDHIHDQEDIYILVNSIPQFLSSKVAFNIFLAQIRSYPKNIYWRSRDNNIINFLRQTKLSREAIVFGHDRLLTFANKLRQKQLHTLPLALPSNENQNTNIEKWLENIELVKKSIATEDFLRRVRPEAVEDNLQGQENTNQFTKKSKQSKPHFTAPKYYTPQPHFTSQSFAHINTPENSTHLIDSYDLPKLKITRVKPRKNVKTSLRKGIIFITSAVLCIYGLGILFSSPLFTATNVYTVEMQLPKKTVDFTTTISTDSMLTRDFTTTQVSRTNATGSEKNINDKPSGRVAIYNSSNNSISLQNGGFYLYYGNKKYAPVKASAYDDTITIINKINQTNVEFDIVAEKDDTSYNLEVGKKLSIVDLAGNTLGADVYALVVQDVSKKSSQNAVTESDLKKLQDQNLNSHNKLLDQEISNLNSSSKDLVFNKYFADTKAITENFSHNVGDYATQVSLESKYTTILSGIRHDVLENRLKEKLPNVNQIQSFEIKEVGNNITDKEVKVLVQATYYEDTNVDTSKLESILNSNPDQANQILTQSEYQNITKIEKNPAQGINLFPSSAKVEVKKIAD